MSKAAHKAFKAQVRNGKPGCLRKIAISVLKSGR
jgi:hypothetical protein